MSLISACMRHLVHGKSELIKMTVKKIVTLLMIGLVQACSHVFYQPGDHQYLDPAQFKMKYQDITFTSKDGTELHGWFFPSTQKPKGTIVQFHGNAQNISTHFLTLAWITREGYNVFIFDYRGYWKSKGTPNQKGVYEDALAALAKGRELNQKNGNGQFIVYGQSLGGIISLRALADYPYVNEVDLIVQDSTFSSYQDIAFNRLAAHWFLVPFSPLAYLLVSDEYASDEVFDKIRRPVLVVLGQKDPIIPQKFGKKIFKGVGSDKKWLWKIPDGGHIDIFHNGHESYRAEFLALLEELRRG